MGCERLQNTVVAQIGVVFIAEEVWLDYPYSPDVFMVSNRGRIHTKGRLVNCGRGQRFQEGQFLSLSDDKDGYKIFSANVNGKRRTLKAHRVVMETFSPKDGFEFLEVNHMDGVKSNNLVENLEWVTRKENMRHALDTGLIEFTKKLYEKTCIECDKVFSHEKEKTKYCSQRCSSESKRLAKMPKKKDLLDLLFKNSFLSVGRMFGISDNAIRKWCDSYNIPRNSSYYRKTPR